MYLLSVLLILLSVFQGASAPLPQTTESSVLQLEQRFTAALVKKDAVAFGELLADDLVHIGFDGRVAGKTEYMTFFKQGTWQYRKYEPSNLAIKTFGGVAVVTGRVDRTITINNGETVGAFAFTHVWSRTGDHWGLTSSQLTNIPTPIS